MNLDNFLMIFSKILILEININILNKLCNYNNQIIINKTRNYSLNMLFPMMSMLIY